MIFLIKVEGNKVEGLRSPYHTKYFKKKEKKETPRRQRCAIAKEQQHNGQEDGESQRKAVAVRYYILHTEADLKINSPVAQPG